MKYKVSVIIPVYNAEKYLRDCFESVVNQTLKDIQIIAVNDGSTDSSETICKEYETKYANFEYYYKENGGSASARNVGLKYARGEYIGFVDADDWIELKMYEKMYAAAKENNNTDMVFCRVFENETPCARDYYFPRAGYYSFMEMKHDIFPYTLPFLTNTGTFRSIRWSNCLRLIKHDVIDNNRICFFTGSRRCEDLGFTLECTIYSNSFYYLDESLYHNRANPDSKTRNYTKNMWKSIRALLVYFQGVLDRYTEYDFDSQMNYCTFYFCALVIRNESTLKNKKKSVELIDKVISDDVCQEAIHQISDRNMNNEYSSLFCYIKSKDAKSLRKYYDKLSFRKKFIVPIATNAFRNQLVKKIYLRIKRK